MTRKLRPEERKYGLSAELKNYLEQFDEHLRTGEKNNRIAMMDHLTRHCENKSIILVGEGRPLMGDDAIENVLNGQYPKGTEARRAMYDG